jgi:hypothetical protein
MAVVNSQNVIAIINNLLSVAGDTITLTGCPSGILNDLSFLNSTLDGPCDDFLRFSNTIGNTTNASFNIDYSGFVVGIQNLLKFQITSSFYIPTGSTYSSGKFSRAFTSSYNLGSDFIAYLYASGFVTTYLPQITLPETQSGGSLQCNPNSSEGPCPSQCVCGVVTGLGTTNTKQITWSPNSLTLNRINFGSFGSITLNNASLNGIFTFQISLSAPSVPPYVLRDPIYHNNPNIPPVFYIYGIQFEQLKMTYDSYTLNFKIFPTSSQLNLELNENEINNLLAKIIYDISDQVNTIVQYQLYPIIYVP